MKPTGIKQSNIFEKVVRQSGRFFRIRFVIVEREGRMRGKIISCEPVEVIDEIVTVEGKYFFPISSSAQCAPRGKTCLQGIVAPFSKLEFFTSQMTRAPSF